MTFSPCHHAFCILRRDVGSRIHGVKSILTHDFLAQNLGQGTRLKTSFRPNSVAARLYKSLTVPKYAFCCDERLCSKMASISGARESFLSFLEALLDSPNDIIDKVQKLIKDFKSLKSEDVRARGEFRKHLRKLNELLLEVERYKDEITNRPLCTKERMDAISMELNCEEEQYARFDFKDENRFPRTISFLHELDIWMEGVKQQYQKVDNLHQKLEEETQKKAEAAQDAMEASKAKKEETMKETMRAWRKVGLIIGTVGGAVITGGAALPVFAAGMGLGAALTVFAAGATAGVGALAGAGAGVSAVAGAGVIASSDDRRDESTHDELRKKYDKINEKGDELQKFAADFTLFSESSVLKKEKDVVLRVRHEVSSEEPKMPLLCDIEPLFQKMFKLLNLDIDFSDINGLKKKLDEIVKEGRK